MSWTFGLRVTVVGALAGSAIACQLIAGLERPLAVDAGREAEPVAPIAALRPNACDYRTLQKPSPPQMPDEAPFEVAVGYIRTDASRAADAGLELCESLGFDLDDKATCFSELGKRATVPPECAADAACAWSSSCANKSGPPCDMDDAGTDNALGDLLRLSTIQLIKNVDPAVADPNALLRSGAANLLIRITGYNGLADDDTVNVALFTSSGLASVGQPIVRPTLFGDSGAVDAADDALVDPGSAEPWDGRALREWYVDPGGLTSVNPLLSAATTEGYVNGHVLVLDNTTLPLPLFGGVLLRLEQGRLVGELRRHGATWEIVRGRLGGRISVEDTIRLVASIPYSSGNVEKGTACADAFLMSEIQRRTCRAADLADRGDQPCGWLSFGATFVAVPAIISGTVWQNRADLPVCDAEVSSACN